jgi:hypothetical protein
MDEHDVRAALAQRLKARANRCLPGRASEDGRKDAEPFRCGLKQRDIIGMDDRLHHRNAGVLRQHFEARAHHRLAGDRPVLLWELPAAGAKSAPGCDYDGCHQSAHCAYPKEPIAHATSLSRTLTEIEFGIGAGQFTNSGIFCTAALAVRNELAKLYAIGVFA